MTFGEWFKGALDCRMQEEADAWFGKECRVMSIKYKVTPERAAELVRHDLGYMAGYYGTGVQKKVLELFGAAHPGHQELIDAADRARKRLQECLGSSSTGIGKPLTEGESSLHDFGHRGSGEGETVVMGGVQNAEHPNS